MPEETKYGQWGQQHDSLSAQNMDLHIPSHKKCHLNVLKNNFWITSSSCVNDPNAWPIS